MKKAIPIYTYKNQYYIGKYNTIKEAAHKARITPKQVAKIADGKQKCTRKGFYFSYRKLTDEEMEKLPIKDNNPHPIKRRDGRKCTLIVEDMEFEASCKNPQLFDFARNKEQRKEDFKLFLFKKLRDRWDIVPKYVATLERQYIRDFLKSV